ncbi:MAG: MucR family transcriptional regulator [Geminicoccaceae bacterium]
MAPSDRSAVPIKRSVRPDGIVCLICGKAQTKLNRHLAAHHELTPSTDETMFGLLDDYPIVAPNYAATRSTLAKKIGLGRKAEPKKKPAKESRKTTTRKPPLKKTAQGKRPVDLNVWLRAVSLGADQFSAKISPSCNRDTETLMCPVIWSM